MLTTGERIMKLRQSRGLSQEALGEKLGVSRQAVSKWETDQALPDVDKVIKMSKLFDVTTDYILMGSEDTKSEVNFKAGDYAAKDNGSIKNRLHYEYKSKRTVFGLPLVHINIGSGAYRAKGIISVGMISTGLISIGLLSVGLISLGILTLGILSWGSISAGLLSLGGVSVGILALGGVAVGVFTIGGLSVGVYSLGGCAIASKIAFGGYAQGYIAIGEKANGDYTWIKNGDLPHLSQSVKNEILSVITEKLPSTPGFILNFFR